MTELPEILPGRACGACTLCCKVLYILEFDKPKGVWCEHCSPKAGCTIYPDRPVECSRFVCGYLGWDFVGEHWLPKKSKMVLVPELDGGRIGVHVDPSFPDAWRKEPYYSDIKRWATESAPDLGQVVVAIGYRAIVILPDEDVDLGIVSPNELIIVRQGTAPGGVVSYEAFKMDQNDPRAANISRPT